MQQIQTTLNDLQFGVPQARAILLQSLLLLKDLTEEQRAEVQEAAASTEVDELALPAWVANGLPRLKSLLSHVKKHGDVVARRSALALLEKQKQDHARAQLQEEELAQLHANAIVGNAAKLRGIQAARGGAAIVEVPAPPIVDPVPEITVPIPADTRATMDSERTSTVVSRATMEQEYSSTVVSRATMEREETQTVVAPAAIPNIVPVLPTTADAARAQERVKQERQEQRLRGYVSSLPGHLSASAALIQVSPNGATAIISSERDPITTADGSKVQILVAFARVGREWICVGDVVAVAGVAKVVSGIYYQDRVGTFVLHDESGAVTCPGHTRVDFVSHQTPGWALESADDRKSDFEDRLAALKPPPPPITRVKVETKREEKARHVTAKQRPPSISREQSKGGGSRKKKSKTTVKKERQRDSASDDDDDRNNSIGERDRKTPRLPVPEANGPVHVGGSYAFSTPQSGFKRERDEPNDEPPVRGASNRSR